MRVVVHPAQQHALIEQRDARLTQHGHRCAKLTVNFIGVVNVVNQDHLQRRTLEAASQRLGDARRDHNWQAAVNTQTLNVRNSFQLGHQPVKLMILRHQGVAAGEDDFIKLRMRRDVVHRRLPVAPGALIFGVWEVAAEAVTTIYRTTAFHQQQGPVAILVQQTGHHAVLFFQRIGGIAGGDDKLFLGGKYLTKQRIVRVAFLHAGDKRARDAQREQASGLASGQQFFISVYI